jgi:hypothetical protein
VLEITGLRLFFEARQQLNIYGRPVTDTATTATGTPHLFAIGKTMPSGRFYCSFPDRRQLSN